MKAKTAEHIETESIKDKAMNAVYCGKSWKIQYTCPVCGKTRYFNLNFVGQHKVLCNGRKQYLSSYIVFASGKKYDLKTRKVLENS